MKLVDTHGSGPCRGNPVEVRVLSSAPLLREGRIFSHRALLAGYAPSSLVWVRTFTVDPHHSSVAGGFFLTARWFLLWVRVLSSAPFCLMRWSVFKIIITLLIVIFPILATAQADQNPGVFFLLQKENKFYFKVYAPKIGPKTVFSVQGRPASIHWDKNFSIIFFRVNNKIFRAVWEIGATPSEILQLEKRFSSEGTAWFEPSIREMEIY